LIEAVLFDFYDSLVRIRTDDWGDEAMRGVAYFLRYHGILMHRADAREAAQEALQRQVGAESDPNFEVDLGLMWRTVIEERASDYAARYDDAYLARLGRTLARIQRSQSRDEFELRDGVLDILHDLHKDYRLGILSNGQGDFVRPELAELEIDHLFEAVVVSSDHGYRKPDPRLFQHGAAAFGLSVSSVVHVGSINHSDGQSAARAGMPAVVFGARTSATRLSGVAVRSVRDIADVPRATREIANETAESIRAARVEPVPVVAATPSVVFASDDLQDVARRIIWRLGTPEPAAAEVARHLVRANLAGHDSHGVMRLPQYAQMIADGTVNPAATPAVIAEKGATVIVDGGGSFGQVSGAFALETATARVGALGAIVVAIRNANHLGRIGDYAEVAASRGHVAIVTVGVAGPGIGGAAPFGGAEPFLSTNPWAFGVPSDAANPVLVDFATTVVPEGKVRVARDAGKQLPTGTILDARGQESTDPNDFYGGGVLLPLGGDVAGHKGYGLAMASALLGALGAIGQSPPNLVGALTPPQGTNEAAGGALLILIDPSAFGPVNVYRQAVGRVSRAVRRVRPTGREAVQVPGDPEARSTSARQKDGIKLPVATVEAIRDLAARFGETFPAPM
jgi:uncharacterized oxidoreductase